MESAPSQIGSDISQEKLEAVSFWCYTFANLLCLCFFIFFIDGENCRNTIWITYGFPIAMISSRYSPSIILFKVAVGSPTAQNFFSLIAGKSGFQVWKNTAAYFAKCQRLIKALIKILITFFLMIRSLLLAKFYF